MPRGSKPGEYRGGRQKGAKNKARANRELAIELAGIEPKAFLLNGMSFYQGQINAELAKARPDHDKVAKAYNAGKEFAKDAAPYCHARLASIEHSGPDGGPIAVSRIERVIVDSPPDPDG